MHTMSTATTRPLISVVALAAAATACQQGGYDSAYVERLGNDTLSIEEFTRSADRIEGRLLLRSPVTRVVTYTAELSPEGAITRLESEMSMPETNPDRPPTLRAVTTINADTVVTIVEQEGEPNDTLAVAVPEGTLLTVQKTPVPMAFLDHVVRSATAMGGDSVPFAVLQQGSPRLASNAVVRSGEQLSIDFLGNPMMLDVSADGGVAGLSGSRTTMKVETKPADPGSLDFDAMAADFAARDLLGEGFGVASPPAQINMEVAGANLEVRYSQPAKRGREIFGGLVPWEVVWRTGANAATHFTTDRNLAVGDASVPAGTYTLWSTFTPESATLIINRQTDQWGTQYDESQDLARVPMTSAELGESVERFTIAIEEADAGAVLKLTWDTSEFSVPIRGRR